MEFGEITQNKCYYTPFKPEGHSRSPMSVATESQCDFLWVIILTDILSRTVSKLSQIIVQILDEKRTLRFW